MRSVINEQCGAAVIFGASAILYTALLPLYAIGVFNDDSLYILAARSLLTGRYAALQLPGQPLASHPLPGLPIFLAFFVKCVQPHWSVLEAIPLAITLISGLLYRKLLRTYVSPAWALVGMALFTLNPITAHLSGAIMAESFLCFFMLLCFLAFQHMLGSDRPWHPYALGVLLGWTSLMRPEAVLLIPCMAVGLIYAERKKDAGIVFSIAISLWLAWLARNAIQTHSLESEYALDLRSVLHYWAAHPASVFVRAGSDWVAFLQGNFLSVVFGKNAWGQAELFLLMSLVGMVSVIGLFRFSRESPRADRGLLLSIGSFGYSYFWIHALWGISEARYFLPLMPLVLVFLLKGVDSLSRSRKMYERLSVIGVAALLISYGYQDSLAMHQSLGKMPRNTLSPDQTLQWIQTRTPPDAVFLSPLGPTLYLYAGRQSLNLVPNKDEDDFRFEVLKRKVVFVLDRPLTFTQAVDSTNPNEEWSRMRRWLKRYPDYFSVVYRNEKESTVLYRVMPDPSFLAAYEEYQSALDDLYHGKASRALNKLDHVLRLQPDMASALNAYGATLLLLRRPAFYRELFPGLNSSKP